MAKWALVAAGLKDLSRPAEKLSLSQNVALTATGFIWVSSRVFEELLLDFRQSPNCSPKTAFATTCLG
jgi:hypothetical protein